MAGEVSSGQDLLLPATNWVSGSMPDMSAIVRIGEILSDLDRDSGKLPPTELYNEGWMLRLCLDWFSRQRSATGPLQALDEADWYSEALLPSAFLPRHRGDRLAESWTHADGVIGHFDIGKESVGGLTLKPDARQIVVTEAKMFSKLSSGVKNASYFNQAARNVACIAEVLGRAELEAAEMDKIGFYVIAPQRRIDEGVFSDVIEKPNIQSVVNRRVSEYEDESKIEWFEREFIPVLERADVRCISWEELIEDIDKADNEFGRALQSFYQKCVRFNEWVGRRF